ncbi:MAG: CBS domain-containing protein [Gammaproteobacteria bacterium]|nr:CBS domain-containing protein [Gammaproteobacteria bacterium]
MEVSEILKIKGFDVISVEPNTSIKDVAKLLNERRIGSVIIKQANGQLAGLVSERDIVRFIAEQEGGGNVDNPVSKIMTADLIVCDLDSAVDTLIIAITKHRIRHLPVMDGDQLVGMVSVGDLLKLRIAELKQGGRTRFEGLFQRKGTRTLRTGGD